MKNVWKRLCEFVNVQGQREEVVAFVDVGSRWSRVGWNCLLKPSALRSFWQRDLSASRGFAPCFVLRQSFTRREFHFKHNKRHWISDFLLHFGQKIRSLDMVSTFKDKYVQLTLQHVFSPSPSFGTMLTKMEPFQSQLDPLPRDLPFRIISKTIGRGAYAS